jgi:hypothetical protein
MKRFLLILILLGAGFARAQHLDSLTMDTLHDAELRLSGLGTNMIQSYEENVRMLNARNFLITLSRALRVRNSYFYRFDSLDCASFMYSPDNKFRIISWNVALNSGTFHYFGVIQLNPEWMKKIKDTANLRNYYPLIDRSEQLENALDTTLGQDHWYGATYYKIIPVNSGKQVFYTLLGWNGATEMTNKKIVDILYFENNKPRFGAPMFDMKETRFKRPLSRMIFEFSNAATMTLKYSEKKKYLIYEVVLPPRPQDYGHPETYLPDGSFEYMLFKNGKWEKQPGLLKDFDLE